MYGRTVIGKGQCIYQKLDVNYPHCRSKKLKWVTGHPLGDQDAKDNWKKGRKGSWP